MQQEYFLEVLKDLVNMRKLSYKQELDNEIKKFVIFVQCQQEKKYIDKTTKKQVLRF